ncbi:MAG TPA: site-2 protease family protein [Candidatus Nanopelagicales bacterium]|nr:site-2 protease family protein [Candidatus Nanopelagicales bacterium]
MIALEVLGWLVILVGIGVSIGLHEIGHLVPAKKFGVRVTQYMVGFGPTIWSRHKGETEYGVKWIPLGGYIRMIGMFPPEKGSDGTMVRASSTGRISTLISDARTASMEEVRTEDRDRVFYKLPVHRRVIIMLGGPTMNLVLAFVFFAIALVGIGIPTPTTTVGLVTPCAPTAGNLAGTTSGTTGTADCATGPSPAAVAGLEPGDVVTAVDGTPVADWPALQDAIVGAGAGPATFTVDRGGSTVMLTADLQNVPRPVYDDAGKQVGTVDKPFLGMAPTATRQSQPLSSVPNAMWTTTTHAVGAIVTLPVRVYDLVQVVRSDQPRDPNGIVGVVGVGRLTGEVVAMENTPVLDKAATVVGILAGLNLFLFLFNLIPLLPLDGGHVAGALWEGIKRSYARVRHRPDPGPVDVAKALPIAYAVSILLIAMSVVILYADLVKPITLQ